MEGLLATALHVTMNLKMNDEKQQAAQQRKVLCIEDERFISELYVRALKKAGYQVDVAVDGQKALEEAQSDKYDIILLDIMIPTISGIDVLKKLRDPAATPNLRAKIIVTTNLDQGEEARAEIEKQADGYIIKADATPRQLVEFLDELKL
ncbi:hypothetical protein BH23PAT1_BH23PAT1_2320 [soil metagenome]